MPDPLPYPVPPAPQACGCDVAVGATIMVGLRTLPAHPPATDVKHGLWCDVRSRAQSEEDARQVWLNAKAETDAAIASFNEAGSGGDVA